MGRIDIFAMLLACTFATVTSAQTPSVAGAPYVPTPSDIVDRMLTLAKVGPKDYVIDLGSGDGRLVITAVAKYKARAGMGIDIEGTLFGMKVEEATVVTLYLLPSMMGQVEEKLRKELKPGTRVVSHDYALPSWKPVEVVT